MRKYFASGLCLLEMTVFADTHLQKNLQYKTNRNLLSLAY